MAEYTFGVTYLGLVVDHALALDIELRNLALEGNQYRMIAVPAFPEEQLEHLGLTEVA